MISALARKGTILAASRTPAALALAEAMKRPAKPKRLSARPVEAPGPIVDCIRLALPIPPSLNSHTRNVPGVGRVKTAAYKQWRDDAGWIVRTAKVGRIVGRYTLTMYVPEKMAGDVDNRAKGCLDLFVSLGVTDDDHSCQDSRVKRSTAIPKGECFVVLACAGAAE